MNPMGKNRYSTSLGKDLVWTVDGAVGDSVVCLPDFLGICQEIKINQNLYNS